MSDAEVERLRRLRGTALQVRALTIALAGRVATQDPLLRQARSAAWRVSRVASGRLRAHPYYRFQRDAGAGVIVWNSIVAASTALRVRTRQQALARTAHHLRRLAREVERARALTWAADLSDALGRSRNELQALHEECESSSAGGNGTATGPTATGVSAGAATAVVVSAGALAGRANYANACGEDWPYLAL